MERQAKLRKLNAFRKNLPHCTAAALAAILMTVKELGVPEGSVNRDALRDSRDLINKEATPYGPILHYLILVGVQDVPKQIAIANPFALLFKAVRECSPFSRFFRQKLLEKMPSPQDPWNLILYSDEVTPGNPLAALNKRKLQAIYLLFLELGYNALSW